MPGIDSLGRGFYGEPRHILGCSATDDDDDDDYDYVKYMQPTTQDEFFCALQDREFNFEKILLKLVKYKLMDLTRNRVGIGCQYGNVLHSLSTAW